MSNDLEAHVRNLSALVAEDISSTSHAPHSVQHLRAPNDGNGNPRRCYVIRSVGGITLTVIDEGYSGLPKWARSLVDLGSVEVTASTYKAWLKGWKSVTPDMLASVLGFDS